MGPPFRQTPSSLFAVHPLLFSRVPNQPLPFHNLPPHPLQAPTSESPQIAPRDHQFS